MEQKMAKKRAIRPFYMVLLIIIIVIFAAGIIGSLFEKDQETEKAGDLVSSGIQIFLNQNPEYGRIQTIKDMPDWASGKRKQVVTSTGTYLFYMKNNQVVGVDEYLPGGGRRKIFIKE
jgi:hypothetical protein